MHSIFLRVLNQHLDVSQAFYYSLFLNWQMLLNFFARAEAFNRSDFVINLLDFCFVPFLYLFILLINESKARANELILKEGDPVLHSEVNVCVQLQQQICDTLANFFIKTIYCYLPQTLNTFHRVRLSFNHYFDCFWVSLGRVARLETIGLKLGASLVVVRSKFLRLFALLA